MAGNIAKRPDGKWRARYRDESGKEHARHFLRKIDAQLWLDEQTSRLLTGTHVAPKHAKITVGPSYQVWIAERLRAEGLPVGAVGLITSSAQAEGILATGQADVISLGRPLLANPHLPITWANELRAPSAPELTPVQYFRARFA